MIPEKDLLFTAVVTFILFFFALCVVFTGLESSPQKTKKRLQEVRTVQEEGGCGAQFFLIVFFAFKA